MNPKSALGKRDGHESGTASDFQHASALSEPKTIDPGKYHRMAVLDAPCGEPDGRVGITPLGRVRSEMLIDQLLLGA